LWQASYRRKKPKHRQLNNAAVFSGRSLGHPPFTYFPALTNDLATLVWVCLILPMENAKYFLFLYPLWSFGMCIGIKAPQTGRITIKPLFSLHQDEDYIGLLALKNRCWTAKLRAS